MPDIESVEALRAELASLFERVLAHGRRTGANDALASLLANAQAQMDAVASGEAPHGRADSAPPPARVRKLDGAKRREGTRAPSGSIQHDVQAILQKSLLPMKVQQIIDKAAENERPLKDTSVRMALMTMRKNGKVRQNDSREWSLTPLSASEPSPVPSDHGHHAMREAA